MGISLFTNKHEQLNILTGSGRNGKSLIVNWLSSILGDYATIAETDMLTTKMRNGVSFSLVNANNARMLFTSEPNNEGCEITLNNNLIKTITGNDLVTARALYKKTQSLSNQLLMFSCYATKSKI